MASAARCWRFSAEIKQCQVVKDPDRAVDSTEYFLYILGMHDLCCKKGSDNFGVTMSSSERFEKKKRLIPQKMM